MIIEVTFNDDPMYALFRGDGTTVLDLHREGLLKLPEFTDLSVVLSRTQPDISNTRLHQFLNFGETDSDPLWYRFRFNNEVPLKTMHRELYAYGHLILASAVTDGSNAVHHKRQASAILMFRPRSSTGVLSLSDQQIARRPHEMASA